MAEFIIEPQDLNVPSTPTGGERLDNVKRLKSSDGSWRFENGALIITDESGVDRVLIGYFKDLF